MLIVFFFLFVQHKRILTTFLIIRNQFVQEFAKKYISYNSFNSAYITVSKMQILFPNCTFSRYPSLREKETKEKKEKRVRKTNLIL